jgi:hypothetical protein
LLSPYVFMYVFVILFLMSVLKVHMSLCYYVLFIHVSTINKTLNLNLRKA